MTLRDAHGNAVSTSSPAALAASESALWRMMSFYGVPRRRPRRRGAARPGLAAAARHAGRLPARPHRAHRCTARRAPRSLPPIASPHGGNARERAHLAAVHRLAAGDWARRGRGLERASRPAPARRAGPAVGPPARLLPRRRAQSLRERVAAVLPAWHERRSAAALRARHARLRARGIGPLRRGRSGRPPGARRPGARALGHPCRRARDGDAGPPRRRPALDGRVAPALGRGQRLRRPPRLARGAVRAGSARPRRRALGLRRATCAPTSTRSRCSASMPHRCCGACNCTVPRSARAGRRCSRAGRSTPPKPPGTRRSTTCTRCWR